MPKRYEAIRDGLMARGVSFAEAKRRAAAIYNAGKKPSDPKLSPTHKKSKRKK